MMTNPPSPTTLLNIRPFWYVLNLLFLIGGVTFASMLVSAEETSAFKFIMVCISPSLIYHVLPPIRKTHLYRAPTLLLTKIFWVTSAVVAVGLSARADHDSALGTLIFLVFITFPIFVLNLSLLFLLITEEDPSKLLVIWYLYNHLTPWIAPDSDNHTLIYEGETRQNHEVSKTLEVEVMELKYPEINDSNDMKYSLIRV